VPLGNGDGDGGIGRGDFFGYRVGSDGGEDLVIKVNKALLEPGGATYIIATPSPAEGW
jgi:hypothetical protein